MISQRDVKDLPEMHTLELCVIVTKSCLHLHAHNTGLPGYSLEGKYNIKQVNLLSYA